ncbi:CBS domain-containing protein [Actinacidiphila soli]|uniref:CBS domain-containing protein n=1 Tax=Actinacidiphila soli TaxID=2487275 RepID=UPI000FCB9EB3|nr:CBS domain-containing protein [Actinacidiphila soli]
MKVSEYMMAPPVTVSPDTTVRQTALRMEDAAVGSVLVATGDRLQGIVTDRDLVVRCLAQGGDPDTAVSDLMSPSVATLDATDDVEAAYRTFRRAGVRRRPVLDGHRLVGVLTVDDLFLDVFQRLADLLGSVAWSVLRDPPELAALRRPTAPAKG